MAGDRVLFLVITGAGPAKQVDVLIRAAMDRGWSVYCIASPTAAEYLLDLAALGELTGHPVRTAHRRPGEPDLPPADAAIVAPATYNTINKFALGIADTYVTTRLAELNGGRVPMLVLPSVDGGLAKTRPFRRSVAELRDWDAVVFDPDYDSADFPWQRAIETIEAMTREPISRRNSRR